MIKRRNNRKHKLIKVLQFHNLKIDNYRDDCRSELEEETLEKYVKDRVFMNSKDIYNISISLCETIMNLNSLKYCIQCSQLDPANIIISKNQKIIIKDFGFSNGLFINDNNVPYLPSFVSSYVTQKSIQKDSSEKVICTIGMLMYYMATGRALITSLDPFLEDSYNSNVDSNLKRIIRKCFHIDITKRYVSVEELKNELIIGYLKKSIYRKTEDPANASEINPEYHYFKRVDKYKRKKTNSMLSRISSTLSTFF